MAASAVLRKFVTTTCAMCHDKVSLLSKMAPVFSHIRSISQANLPVHFKYRDHMKYGIYAVRPGLVKANALESARLAIIRKAKNKQINMIKAQIAVTKKPLGTRMGKGKGKVDHYVANVKAGKLMFEFNCDSETLAHEAYRQACNRLPVKTHFRIRPTAQKEMWTHFEH